MAESVFGLAVQLGYSSRASVLLCWIKAEEIFRSQEHHTRVAKIEAQRKVWAA